jgi:hypothetical protein
LKLHGAQAPPNASVWWRSKKKELGKARAMTTILAAQSEKTRAKGDALIRQADRLICESWNERMWADGEPIDPSPTVDQAINGGYPWLEIECSRCKTQRDVDLAGLPHAPTTFIHDLGCTAVADIGNSFFCTTD